MRVKHIQVDAKGAAALADALRDNTSVTSFNLYKNQIGDAGANSFGKMLKYNKTLVRLGLGSNGITDGGCSFLVTSA